MPSILLVEDDLALSEAIKLFLEQNKHTVDIANSLITVEKMLNNQKYDLIILDINLVDGTSWSIPKKIENIPFVFLTARDEEKDILKGYRLGCDEYIVKPISLLVLNQKIQAILKRNIQDTSCKEYFDLKFYFKENRVFQGDKELNLSNKERKLIFLFAENQGRILTKEMILESIWGIEGDFVDEHAVVVCLNRLKKKLAQSSKQEYIENVFGIGYVFGSQR
ncbi:response regulator transcription factor [Enterococcus cecorum]|uniref:response regulator transcription factor n=1 Tax=Enterococcus cecorum TaxID=44008 RepID=UPI000A53D645|nr:response regulator transcription factor [Enterococcus cecorum]CAI3457586.1 response regulator transcription factor [Enterococcus cecorum]